MDHFFFYHSALNSFARSAFWDTDMYVLLTLYNLINIFTGSQFEIDSIPQKN